MASEQEELCLIDSSIQSLRNLPLHPHLTSLSLHCNLISSIENLSHLRNLIHLDLSSNQITRIEGLDSLRSLQSLNLSCNLIQAVSGLTKLVSLVKLNLSFNQIVDLSGFQVIQGATYQLNQLDLHGNRIQAIRHVQRSLEGCHNLRHLSLAHSGADNPVCHSPDYRLSVLGGLPRLQTLDGMDRSGNLTTQDRLVADVPGLDQYLEYLVSNGSSDGLPMTVPTPRIDALLEAFKHHGTAAQEYSSSNFTEDSTGRSGLGASVDHAQATPGETDYELRLKTLEKQLEQLLFSPKKKQNTSSSSTTPRKTPSTTPKKAAAASKASRKLTPSKVNTYPAKRDTDVTDESGSESSTLRGGNLRSPKGRQQRGSPRARKQQHRDPTLVVEGNQVSPLRHAGSPATSATSPSSEQGRRVQSTVRKDEKQRDELRTTYVQLMGDLETERERRWKSEQATKKLLQHVTEIQNKAKDGEDLQAVALQATSRLKEVVSNEREANLRLHNQLEDLQEDLKTTKVELESSKNSVKSQQAALRTHEATIAKLGRERLEQEAHQTKKVHEAQARAAACGREVDILRAQATTLKGQLHQLQELLAVREQKHKEELNNRYTLGSPQLQEVLKQEVARMEKCHAEEMRTQRGRIDTLSRQYAELEDEFRTALQIEASRFSELQSAFEAASQDGAHNKHALSSALKKEESMNAMINELTALVKEQKGRISELVKAKTEQSRQYKERIESLEHNVEEARKRMVQLEMLKQERTRLSSQLQAQESVIEGLKAERKIWGEELAQQGVSLASDRGRMEAKIETLTTEVHMLKKQLEREADAVRIKTKLIDDQTETIRRLKEGLLERDQVVRKAREDAAGGLRDLEEQLTAETGANQELQEQLDLARERKNELKQQVTELEEQLDEMRKEHSTINNKWKAKSNVIGQLEEQVARMKELWENKEAKLTQERDKSLDAARIAVNKIQALDDAFRRQLDAKEDSHQRAMEKLMLEKQEEIDEVNKRVIEVEEEMREILRESANAKRSMEEKFKKLSTAFADMQHDLL